MFKLNEFTASAEIMTAPKDLNFLIFSGRSLFHKQKFFGENTVVAVVDTGVSIHPEFENRLLNGINTNSGYPSYSRTDFRDDVGHGTHVAATIAGKTCGIAPKAKILPVKVLHPAFGCTFQDLVAGLEFVRDWKGPNNERVDIVNMSLSAPEAYAISDPNAFNALHSVIKDLVNKGILVVCAAGNSGKEEKNYPGYFDEVVEVGAVDINKKEAYFTTKNNQVDVCQIGIDVTSAWYQGGYIAYSGTSMATPMISGIAALLINKYKSIFKTYMPEPALFECIKLNTIDLGVPGADIVSGAGFCCLNPNPLKIEVKIDSSSILVNNIKYTMPTQAKNINGTSMIPLRSVFEAFGGNVKWDATNNKAIIDY